MRRDSCGFCRSAIMAARSLPRGLSTRSSIRSHRSCRRPYRTSSVGSNSSTAATLVTAAEHETAWPGTCVRSEEAGWWCPSAGGTDMQAAQRWLLRATVQPYLMHHLGNSCGHVRFALPRLQGQAVISCEPAAESRHRSKSACPASCTARAVDQDHAWLASSPSASFAADSERDCQAWRWLTPEGPPDHR